MPTAWRSCIRALVLPVGNGKDNLKPPKIIRQGMVFHYLDTISTVFAIAAEQGKE